ncbi:hypothetical protein [Actinomadura montaniterrae]|nr:hypothetical protein [Actinomadura montaniterrae]
MIVASGDADVLTELLLDRLLKGAIVLAALIVLVAVLTVVYRKAGPKDPP